MLVLQEVRKMDTQKFPPLPICGVQRSRTGFQTYEATVKKQRRSMMGGSALQHLFCGRCGMVARRGYCGRHSTALPADV